VGEGKKLDGGRFLFVVAAFVVVVAGMQAAVSILVPFLLSVFVAIICAPFLFWLRQKRIPGLIAVGIVIIVVLGIGASIGVLVGTSVKDFSAALPEYQVRLQDEFTEIISFLNRIGIEVSNQVLLEYFNPGAVMRFVGNSLTTISSGLTNAFFILLTVVFILLEVSSFPVKLRAILGDSHPSLTNFDKVIGEVKRYLVLKTLTSLATGIAIAAWLAALGVDYPLLWGLLAFVLNFVPSIGSIIAAIPAVLLALIQLGSWWSIS
jgi:AI-2 transport protein TqsA